MKSSPPRDVLEWLRTRLIIGKTGASSPYALKSLVRASGLFNDEFYAVRYLADRGRAQEALDHYVETGMRANYHPSASFDPDVYLTLNPDVATAEYPPLLHFIQYGCSEGRRRPDGSAQRWLQVRDSGLFDSDLYLELYPDVAHAGLDPLEHYLSVGFAEGRRPSMEFDAEGYLALYSDVAEAGANPLLHYIDSGKAEERLLPKVPFDRLGLARARAALAASPIFDELFYLAENPVLRDSGTDPALHYIMFGAASYHEPSASVSTRAYLCQHPEAWLSREHPFLHFLSSPASEMPCDVDAVRRPTSDSRRRLPNQEFALEQMAGVSFFDRFGFTFEASGPTHYIAEAVAALAVRKPTLNVVSARPDVSIVIPVYGQMHFVLGCLDALSRHVSHYSVEIIVSDDVSPAQDRTEFLAAIPWIRYNRQEFNGGFLDNCNAAAGMARGRNLVLLNSDTRVIQGWLDELVGSFTTFPKAGFVGSKLLNADGSLQEAGGLYWSDGTPWNYGRNQDAADPRYCYARQVDWVSGASIAIPMAIWEEVGGFNEAYRPAYCEDVDLAFRIRALGYEVWYQPLSQVIHYEGMTHGRDEASGIKVHQRTNLKRLQEMWRGKLPGKRAGGESPDREANRSISRTMLIIDANTHTPDRDAGSHVAFKMMQAFRELGFSQTFFPLHNPEAQGHYTDAYQRLGVEVLYSPFFNSVAEVLKYRSTYDYVLIFRYGVAQEVLEPIRKAVPTARILFSNVDLHYLRMEREAALKSDASLSVLASWVKSQELKVLALVDCSVVHTPVEKNIILEHLPAPLENILVFPWIADVKRSDVGREARRNVMFLGGFAHPPNVDAVQFFLDDVWPLLKTRLPQDARFMIVGSNPPDSIRVRVSDRVVVTGLVPDLTPYFDQARVLVAPLRFGAGIKGKLIESMAKGTPAVATSIASEGMGLTNGEQCIVADTPGAIADSVVRLYDSPDVWLAQQEAGYRFVEERYSSSVAVSLCRAALDLADQRWLTREAHERQRDLRALMLDEGLMLRD